MEQTLVYDIPVASGSVNATYGNSYGYWSGGLWYAVPLQKFDGSLGDLERVEIRVDLSATLHSYTTATVSFSLTEAAEFTLNTAPALSFADTGSATWSRTFTISDNPVAGGQPERTAASTSSLTTLDFYAAPGDPTFDTKAQITLITQSGGSSFASFTVDPKVTVTYVYGPTASFSITDAQITEGDEGTTSAVFNVSLSQSLSHAATVNFVTLAGTATVGEDFLAESGIVTFAPGETTRTVNVQVVGDKLAEELETFQVLLSGAAASAGAAPTIADATGLGTIQDNDDVYISALGGDVTTEGVNASKFTLKLSGPAATPVTVTYSTVDGTAEGGRDFEAAASKTVVIPKGEDTAYVYIPLIADSTVEPREFFSLRIDSTAAEGGAAPRVQSGFKQASVNINDDDTATLNVSAKTASVTEGRDAAYFVFTLNNPVAVPTTVTYSTLDGSAKSGTDFNSGTSRSVVIKLGEILAETVVLLVDDEKVENPEFFSLQVDSISAGGIPAAQLQIGAKAASISIYDDDSPMLPKWVQEAFSWIYDPLHPRWEQILEAVLQALQASPDGPPGKGNEKHQEMPSGSIGREALEAFVKEQLERLRLGDEEYERIYMPQDPTPPPTKSPAPRGPGYLDRFLDEAFGDSDASLLTSQNQTSNWSTPGDQILV